MLGFSRSWTRKVSLGCGLGSSRGSVAQVGAGGARRYSRCVSAGEYMCCFEAQGFRWELYHMVRVPLQATDVARLPDQLSISCAASSGFQLSCCIPNTHLGYTASWSPGADSKGMERGWLSGVRERWGSSSPLGSWLSSSPEAEAAVHSESSGSKSNTDFSP